MNVKPIFDTGQNKKIAFATDSVIFTDELTKNLTVDWFGGRRFSAQQNLEHLEILSNGSGNYLCLYILVLEQNSQVSF